MNELSSSNSLQNIKKIPWFTYVNSVLWTDRKNNKWTNGPEFKRHCPKLGAQKGSEELSRKIQRHLKLLILAYKFLVNSITSSFTILRLQQMLLLLKLLVFKINFRKNNIYSNLKMLKLLLSRHLSTCSKSIAEKREQGVKIFKATSFGSLLTLNIYQTLFQYFCC